MTKYTWARKASDSFEVSSKGNPQYSALNALMEDGRTLEMHYQCCLKGFEPGGTNWRLGKGQNPKDPNMTREQLWEGYLALWRRHFKMYPNKLSELKYNLDHLGITVLTDMFAMTPINQAHAISVILNDTEVNTQPVVYIGIKNSHHKKEWYDPRCLYAGRGSPLGNPFEMKSKEDRDRVCDEYEAWFKDNLDKNEELMFGLGYALNKARGGVLYLRCFCAPKRCHTETIKKHLLTQLVEEGYVPLEDDPSLTTQK